MSLLSDRALTIALAEGEDWDETQTPRFPANALRVSPVTADTVQPASIDLRLGGEFAYWPHPSTLPDQRPIVIDPMAPEAGGLAMLRVVEDFGDTFIVAPGQFVLAHTHEGVRFGSCLAGQVYGKSSIGRLGLEVENAGYIDPGFEGQITLELKNCTEFRIRLTVGMPIAQMAVERLTSPAQRPYGHPDRESRYQGQVGATPSRYGLGRRRAPAGGAGGGVSR